MAVLAFVLQGQSQKKKNIQPLDTGILKKGGNAVKAETIYVQNGKNQIYGQMYKPDGDGKYPLLIYSHGYGYNYEEYDLQEIARHGIAAYRFDFCGGSPDSRSDGRSTDMSVKTEATDLEAVLNTLKELSYIDLDRIYLSGNSQGSFVSTMVGISHKDEIRGMFLLCPAYVIIDFRKMYGDFQGTAQFGNMMISEKYVTDAEEYDLYNEMKNYDGQVIIYHGTRDGMAPISYSEKAIQYFPNAELYPIKGVGHMFGGRASAEIESDIIEHILEN